LERQLAEARAENTKNKILKDLDKEDSSKKKNKRKNKRKNKV
jgi:hypothetical protein